MNWQRIQSRISPPPGLRKYVAGIVENTVEEVFEDLIREAKRIRRGGKGIGGLERKGFEEGKKGGGWKGFWRMKWLRH